MRGRGAGAQLVNCMQLLRAMSKPTPSCGARRLSDLLQEQQEPFLHAHCATAAPRRYHSVAEGCGRRLRRLCGRGNAGAGAATALRRSLLCGGDDARPATRALRWGHLAAGCFSCSCGAPRQRFRRLPRAVADAELDGGGDGALGCGSTQLSPVSVLEVDLHSDDESTSISLGDEHDNADCNCKPSTTSGPSPPPCNHVAPRSTFFVTNGKVPVPAMEVEHKDDTRAQRKRGAEDSLLAKEQAVVSAWERIAADISRVPTLVALDFSRSARDDWRRLAGEEEARRVGQSIEAMIFEEVRWEALHDMVCTAPH